MIDYNYYTKLNDRELEKIVSHIKNIQNLRFQDFQNAFSSSDIEKISLLMPEINKDKLNNAFQNFQSNFQGTKEQFNLYVFLKTNDLTKNFDFSTIESELCSRYPTIEYFEIIKEKFPETFLSLKSKLFSFVSPDIISYLHKNDFIDFDSIKKSSSANSEVISYMLNQQLFKNFDDFPFVLWFPNMRQDTLQEVISHFNLPLLNFEELYYKSNELSMKDYMKNSIKFKTVDFLEVFSINEFFVQEFSKTIDKVSDNTKPLDFILKMYYLIEKEDSSVQQHLIDTLKSQVKKPKNKEILSKVELHFNLQKSLPDKNNKSSLLKI